MARKQFKSIKEMQSFIEKVIPTRILTDRKVENVLRSNLSKSIINTVYKEYQPKVYERRGKVGGLADESLMQIVDAFVDGGKFKVIFQSIAQGNDTLSGQLLSETIIDGIKDNWNNPNGEWSEPRDFIEDMYSEITANPKPLIKAVKQAFIDTGFKVR